MLDYRIHFAKLVVEDRLRVATNRIDGSANPSRVHRVEQQPSPRRTQKSR